MSNAVQAFKRQAPARTTAGEFEDDARPYVIVGDIGKGSFATVYKGYHEDTRQTVAIKQVKRDNLTTKLFENLQSEIQILKSLSHRHITKLIDIVRAEKHIYLIMEYCAGGDLTNYIKKRGRVEGLEYVPSPGAALQYYPHPRTGGLDETTVRSFLRQLGEFEFFFLFACLRACVLGEGERGEWVWVFVLCVVRMLKTKRRPCVEISAASEFDP
ncbi:hypothetical protein CVT25_004477 [Psilocybe cyanescens]|uniref:non-specific serine/threonine protein kinase n=1 Tax=Psilocybe cyanescens TaxID=93625 RepID=A0A409X2J2_PSICY|nr:hypothetical protein CVT25_004477 [Psilocybe cyanescens]